MVCLSILKMYTFHSFLRFPQQGSVTTAEWHVHCFGCWCPQEKTEYGRTTMATCKHCTISFVDWSIHRQAHAQGSGANPPVTEGWHDCSICLWDAFSLPHTWFHLIILITTLGEENCTFLPCLPNLPAFGLSPLLSSPCPRFYPESVFSPSTVLSTSLHISTFPTSACFLSFLIPSSLS